MDGGPAETPKTDAFIQEVIEVCKQHGLSISHEDSGGAFVINEFNDDDAKWLMEARVGKGNQESSKQA